LSEEERDTGEETSLGYAQENTSYQKVPVVANETHSNHDDTPSVFVEIVRKCEDA
jgi:hypothetical protein